MSRLRRLVLSDRFFFISCRVWRCRGALEQAEFQCLARVVRERREKYHFLLTAWVFLPDHWHAILFPRFPVTISRLMESIKVGSTLRVNARRNESGLLWQPRFFDRALRTVKEYNQKVEQVARSWSLTPRLYPSGIEKPQTYTPSLLPERAGDGLLGGGDSARRGRLELRLYAVRVAQLHNEGGLRGADADLPRDDMLPNQLQAELDLP